MQWIECLLKEVLPRGRCPLVCDFLLWTAGACLVSGCTDSHSARSDESPPFRAVNPASFWDRVRVSFAGPLGKRLRLNSWSITEFRASDDTGKRLNHFIKVQEDSKVGHMVSFYADTESAEGAITMKMKVRYKGKAYAIEATFNPDGEGGWKTGAVEISRGGAFGKG